MTIQQILRSYNTAENEAVDPKTNGFNWRSYIPAQVMMPGQNKWQNKSGFQKRFLFQIVAPLN